MRTGCPQSSHADHASADKVWTSGSLALGKTSSGSKLGASVAVVGLRAARLAHLDISEDYIRKDLYGIVILERHE